MSSLAPAPRARVSIVALTFRTGSTLGVTTEEMTTSKSLIDALPLFGYVVLGFQLVGVLQLALELPTQLNVCVVAPAREVKSTTAMAPKSKTSARRRVLALDAFFLLWL